MIWNISSISTLHPPHFILIKGIQNVKEDKTIRVVPVKYRGTAENFFKWIDWEPFMHWYKQRESIHIGHVIKGSNIIDLVNDITWDQKDFYPHGSQEFAHAPCWGNAPQDLVGNQRRWDWVHHESATTNAFSMSEKSRPERLSRSYPRCRTPAQQRTMSKIIKQEQWPMSVKMWEPLT